MNDNERNEHFKGFANLHYPELSKLFFTLYARIEEHRPIEEIDAVEDEIKTLLAQRGYDLAIYLYEFVPMLRDTYPNLLTIQEVIRHIPDLTEWPTPE